MKIRLKFAKKADAAYLGHLDIMRFFQRLFNRSGVKMEYSKGFNPHQLMSFAQPLGVGTTSTGDYLDAEIADGQDLDLIMKNMNLNSGSGFEVINIKELKEDAKSSMAMLRAASYLADIADIGISEDDAQKAVDEVLAAKKIEVIKKTKKKETVVDIRPAILELGVSEGHLKMVVNASSADNLKPSLLIKTIAEKSGVDYKAESIRINRTEMFAEDMVPLDEFQIK